MSYTTLLLHIHESTATITLNRPEKRNALSPALLNELRAALHTVQYHDDVKVVVLCAEGKTFCAGIDLAYLQEISQFSTLDNLADSRRLAETLHTLYTFPKPIVAKVRGAAIAGGCGIISVCDAVIADRDHASFCYSEVRIGFIPAIVSVYLLKKVGDTRARDLLLTARTFSAVEAEHMGFITRAVRSEELDKATDEYVHMLANNSSSAMTLTKGLMANLHGMSLEAGIQYACSMNVNARSTDDCKDGIAKFLTKENRP